MNEDSPWITLFDRQSKSGKSARFQVATAQIDPGGLLQVALVGFELVVKASLTQVLFVKYASNSTRLKYAAGKATIYEAALRISAKPSREPCRVPVVLRRPNPAASSSSRRRSPVRQQGRGCSGHGRQHFTSGREPAAAEVADHTRRSRWPVLELKRQQIDEPEGAEIDRRVNDVAVQQIPAASHPLPFRSDDSGPPRTGTGRASR